MTTSVSLEVPISPFCFRRHSWVWYVKTQEKWSFVAVVMFPLFQPFLEITFTVYKIFFSLKWWAQTKQVLLLSLDTFTPTNESHD